MASLVERRHFVQFFEDSRFLAERVSSFLCEALGAGGTAAAVARPSHLAAIVLQLERAGVDVDEMLANDRLVLADAQIMLDLFMVAGSPDPARFEQTIGARMNVLRERAHRQPV